MTDETLPPDLPEPVPADDPVAGAVVAATVRDRRERCAVTKKLRPRKELTLLDSLRPELADHGEAGLTPYRDSYPELCSSTYTPQIRAAALVSPTA